MKKSLNPLWVSTLPVEIFIKPYLAIFILLFFSGWPSFVNAQTPCSPDIGDFDFSGEATLCEQYGGVGPDPGQTYSGTTFTSSLPSQTLSGLNILIGGNFIINTSNFTVNNCTVKMLPGASITIEANNLLTVTGSRLFSCDQMWQGINVLSTGRIIFSGNEIEDAQYAVQASSSCQIEIKNNIFNRNWQGLHLGLNGINGQICVLQIRDNQFNCSKLLSAAYPGQTPAPGAISQIGIFTVGGTFVKIDRCHFDTQLFGIFSLGTVGNIKACRFNNMIGGTTIGNFQSGVGIFASWNADLGITGEGNLPASPLTFSACHFAGVHAIGANITVSHTSANNIGEQLIRTEGMANNKASIILNRVEGPVNAGGTLTTYVYFMERSANLSEKISVNRFEFAERVGGIAYHASFGANLPFSWISNNVLNLMGQGSIGMDLHKHRNFSVSGNQVNMDKPMFATHLEDANGESEAKMGVKVTFNTYTCPGPQMFHNENSRYVQFCTNRFFQGTEGLKISGTCTGSQLFENGFFNQSLAGLIYNGNAITGGQPHRGNYWVNSKARHTGNNWLNSTYFVNSSLLPPDPNGTYLPITNVGGWFVDESLPVNQCQLPLGGDPPVTALDILIANGMYESQVDNELDAWMAKRALYEKLEENPALRVNNTLMSIFWQTHQQNTIGKLYAVDKYIRNSIAPSNSLSSSLDATVEAINQTRIDLVNVLEALDTDPGNPVLLANKASLFAAIGSLRNVASNYSSQIKSLGESHLVNAQSINASITGVTDYESNEKSVNEILIAHLASGDTIMSLARRQLARDIATQCPNAAGPAVSRAMLFLPSCEQIDLHNHDGCLEDRTIKAKANPDFNCLILPNPADESLSIQFNKVDDYSIQVFNPSGILIMQLTCKGANQVVNTNQLSDGVYYFKVNSASGVSTSGKFIVLH